MLAMTRRPIGLNDRSDLSRFETIGRACRAAGLARRGGAGARAPIRNPDTLYLARFTAPEFTSLCPVTGQPDFAHLVIDYAPDDWLIECKSLKLYLGSFRNHGAFHEDCTLASPSGIVAEIDAALAAHRRLLVSARRHPDRRVLADRRAARGTVAARPGRRALSRAGLILVRLFVMTRARPAPQAEDFSDTSQKFAHAEEQRVVIASRSTHDLLQRLPQRHARGTPHCPPSRASHAPTLLSRLPCPIANQRCAQMPLPISASVGASPSR